MSLLQSESVRSSVDVAVSTHDTVDSLPRKRTFILLRFGFLIAASYLLLVARDFATSLAVNLMIAGVLTSNLLLVWVPTRFFEGVKLTGGVIVFDMALVTVALLSSGEFGWEFFLLYFAVLFLAAMGESLPLIIVASVVGTFAYFWVGSDQGRDPTFWSSDALMRFPFLLMVALFFGYFVVRLRREKNKALEEAHVAANLEQAHQAIADHARHVEDANRKLEEEVQERAQAEAELEEANTKLKQADQLKTDFISVVSHELRTPLTSISNSLNLLVSGKAGEINDKQERFLEMARRNTERLSAIINDLLDLSKVEAGKAEFEFSEVEIGPLLSDLSVSFETLAQESLLELVVECEEELPTVWIDARRIEQVVTNLTSNALKHSEAGGRVDIEARAVPEGVEIAVRDTGVGLSPEDQVRVFERFYQVGDSLTRKASGTGLGLPIVKQLLGGHGSRIHVESELGVGSRFWFNLPTPSSRTVEMLDFESEVARYRTQAGFFTLLVLQVASPESGEPLDRTEETELLRVFEAVEERFPRSADHVVLQKASGRVILALLMTPMSGAEVVKGRLTTYLADLKAEGAVPSTVISGPSCLPDHGSTGRAVIARALEEDGGGQP